MSPGVGAVEGSVVGGAERESRAVRALGTSPLTGGGVRVAGPDVEGGRPVDRRQVLRDVRPARPGLGGVPSAHVRGGGTLGVTRGRGRDLRGPEERGEGRVEGGTGRVAGSCRGRPGAPVGVGDTDVP